MRRQRELLLSCVEPTGITDVVVSGRLDTVADLAVALGGSPTGLVIDGDPWPANARLTNTGIGNGSVVGGEPGAPCPEVEWSLRSVAGPATGVSIDLAALAGVIGRALLPDPTVSLRHFSVEGSAGSFLVGDLGSTNGTFVNGRQVRDRLPIAPGGVIAAGASRLVLERPAVSPRPHSETRHHRPPRRPLPASAPALVLPAAVPAPTLHVRFSWAAVAAPLLLGMGMAALFDWRMVAFALLSPVLGIGTWIEDRRRARHDRRAITVEERCSLERFTASLQTAVEVERARRDAALPSASTCVSLALAGDARIWERRRPDTDFGTLRLGRADLPWRPRVERPSGGPSLEEAARLAESAVLPDCSVGVAIGDEQIIGIWGDRAAALGVARSLVVQAAVLHGPADLRVAAVTDPVNDADWEWVKWLPHHDPAGGVAVAAMLTIVDGTAGCHAMTEPTVGRCAIVVAPRRELLPARCTQIVSVADPPLAVVEFIADCAVVERVAIDGVPLDVAEAVARRLAPLVDPDADASAEQPATLTDLTATYTPEEIRARWTARDLRSLAVAIGTTAGRPFSIDLVADGPHALVAGTTGAGKSELLRSWIAALAASYSPARVTFFLIDYKGGSAFDACTALPHVVGCVTDLDGDLAERALVSLEAELRHRETRLRATGTPDITALPQAPDKPMPRLVIVIDEFAALQRDLPDFVDALVQIAQRGRSLGLHLVLATQRPQGVVSESIRANTNLRICLRVQDPAESQDVIGAPDAASLPPSRPGSAIVRIGQGELVSFRAARSSGLAGNTVSVRPFTRSGEIEPAVAATPAPEQATELDEIVAVVRAAASSVPPPRRPWLRPLPTTIDLADLPARAAARADDPARQRQPAWEWHRGPIQLYGVTGAGTSTALAALAVAAARATPPDDLHIYALDFGAGGFDDLALLPHTGAVVRGADTEHVVAAIDWLHDVVSRRRAARTKTDIEPRIVVLLDGWGAFAAAFDTLDGMAVRERMMRVVTDGAAVGVDVAVSGDSPITIPSSLAMAVPAKLVFRLADRHDYAVLGVASREPFSSPGRCVDAATGLTMQFASPTPAAMADAARWPAPHQPPQPVEPLPREVKLADVIAAAASDDNRLSLPLGVRRDGTSPALVEIETGEHVLVVGTPASGRSTALAVLAASAAVAAPGKALVAFAPARSPLASSATIDRWIDGGDPEAVEVAVGALVDTAKPTIVLVDDADRCAGETALHRLVAAARPNLHLFVSARPDTLRGTYGHWLQQVRNSAITLVLQATEWPDAETIAGRSLPRRPFIASVPGRGELVTARGVELVQVAVP